MASLCSLRGEVGSGICVYWIAAVCVAQPWVYGGARWARQLFCAAVWYGRGALRKGQAWGNKKGEREKTEGRLEGTEGRKRRNRGDGRERDGMCYGRFGAR